MSRLFSPNISKDVRVVWASHARIELYTSKSQLDAHLAYIHQKMNCAIIAVKVLSNRTTLRNHLALHTGEEKVACV